MEHPVRSMADYEMLLNRARPVPRTRRPMPSENRAAQFAPYAALVGFGELVDEEGRLVSQKLVLDEGQKERINRRLRLLSERLPGDVPVTLTVFVPDPLKAGGAYELRAGLLKRVDPVSQTLLLRDGSLFALEDLLAVEGADPDDGEAEAV